MRRLFEYRYYWKVIGHYSHRQRVRIKVTIGLCSTQTHRHTDKKHRRQADVSSATLESVVVPKDRFKTNVMREEEEAGRLRRRGMTLNSSSSHLE